jgi:DNA primase
MLTHLPDGLDPADWLAQRGTDGLSAFDPAVEVGDPRPVHAGRELTRAALASAHDPVRDTLRDIVPVLLAMDGRSARALAAPADGEMTRHGWNPKGTFTETLAQAVAVAAAQRRDLVAPQSRRLEPPPAHRRLGIDAGPAAYR